MPGFLTALIAKLAGLGTVAKAAIATATAALTLAAAGGATGVLPLPGGQTDPGVVAQAAVPQTTAAVPTTTSTPATTSTTAVKAAGGASVGSSTGSTSTKATTSVATPANLPTFAGLPAIPSCVSNLIPTGGTVPDPAQLVTQLPACILSVVTSHLPLDTIQSVIGSANLPVDLSKCLSSVIGSLPTFAGGDLSGLPKLLSACLPTGSIPGMNFVPGMSGISSMPGMSFFSGFKPGR